MFKCSIKGVTLVVAATCSIAAAMGQQVQVTFSLPGTNGGPTSVQDTYLFFGVYPYVTTPVVYYNEGTITNGEMVSVPDPIIYPAGFYEFITMGVYTDANGAAHAVLGTQNDLTGGNWDSMFAQINSNYDEANIIADLQNNQMTWPSNLASSIVSIFENDVFPITGTGAAASSGYLSEFSTGTNIGSISATAPPTPEPSSLLVLGLAPIALLRRRR